MRARPPQPIQAVGRDGPPSDIAPWFVEVCLMRIWDARLVRCSFSTSREELAIFGALNCSHPELFTCIQNIQRSNREPAARPASLLHFGWCRFVGVRRVTAARNSRTSGMLLGQVHVGKLWVCGCRNGGLRRQRELGASDTSHGRSCAFATGVGRSGGRNVRAHLLL